MIAVGPVRLERAVAWEELVALSRREEVLLGVVDAAAEARMKEVVDEAYAPAIPWAASSKWWPMACRPAWART